MTTMTQTVRTTAKAVTTTQPRATRHRHANATRDDGQATPTPPHGHDVSPRARSKPLRRYPPEVLTDAEVAALLAACREDSPAGIRNRALLTVLYRAGLRITETLALRPIDLDPRSGAIRVLHAKGGRSRMVGMDCAGFEIVEQWLEARRSLPVTDADPVFCLINGRPMASSYVRVFLPRLARKAGLVRRVHAHGLRHTHAAELRQEGVDIGLISKQLGHRSIATTARYLDHIAPWDVVAAMRGREW